MMNTVGENIIVTIKMQNNFCYPLKLKFFPIITLILFRILVVATIIFSPTVIANLIRIHSYNPDRYKGFIGLALTHLETLSPLYTL